MVREGRDDFLFALIALSTLHKSLLCEILTRLYEVTMVCGLGSLLFRLHQDGWHGDEVVLEDELLWIDKLECLVGVGALIFALLYFDIYDIAVHIL